MFTKILLSLTTLLCLWVITPTLFLRKIPVLIQEGTGYTQEIGPGKSKDIDLFVKAESLSQLQLLLKNKGLQNNDQFIVTISSGKNAKAFLLNGSNVGDPSWLKIKLSNFAVTDNLINIKLSVASTSKYSLFWHGQAEKHLSLQLYTTPDYKQRFISSLRNLAAWLQTTDKSYLILYISVLLFLCII